MVKKLAQDIARKIAKEPFEIAKTAEVQLAGLEKPVPEQKTDQPEAPQMEEQEGKKKDLRRIQALEQEIKEIRMQKENKKEKEEEVKKTVEEKQEEPVPKVSTKPSRKFFAAQRQQTRVEKILPPSG